MAVWNLRSRRKSTSGKYKTLRRKRKFNRGRNFTETHLGSNRLLKSRVEGGNLKLRLKRAEFANLTNTKTGKATKAKIIDIIENHANLDYIRRDIITKGAIISTEKGNAKVTSRPGQHGIVNAVLID